MLFSENDGILGYLHQSNTLLGNEKHLRSFGKGKFTGFASSSQLSKAIGLSYDQLVDWQTVSTARTSVIGACCQTLGTTYLAIYFRGSRKDISIVEIVKCYSS